MKRRRHWAEIGLVLLLTHCGGGRAQSIPTRAFWVGDGLTQSQVTAISHDSHKFLWFATQGGVSRSNGSRFFSYTVADGLPDDLVTALAAADRGRMYLGTESGAVVLWHGSGFESSPGPGGGRRPVTGLAWLGDQRLLVGTADALWTWTPSEHSQLLDRPVTSIVVPLISRDATDIRTWPLVVAGDIFRTDGRTLHDLKVRATCTLAADENPLSADADAERLWVGTDRGRVFRIEEPARCVLVGDRFAAVRTVLGRSDGGAWAGTNLGLWHLSRDGTAMLQALDPGAPAQEIQALGRDFEGNLWASPFSGGLYRFDPEGHTIFNRASGFPASMVWSFLEDEQECVWMGTEDTGAIRWCRSGISTHLRIGAELPQCRIPALEADGAGGVWLGTSAGVFHHTRSGNLHHYSRRQGLPDEYVRALRRDPAGSLWIATRNGLARWSQGRIQSFSTRDGLPDANLRGLDIDRQGRLWIATHSAGVARFDGTEFHSFGMDQGLPIERVWCLIVDSRNRVLAGTDAGLWIHDIDSGQSRSLTYSGELPSRNILFLKEARDGSIWAGTTRGIVHLTSEGRVIRVLTTEDGLVDSEAASNAATIDREGRLWVGLANGVNRIDPDSLTRVTPVPALAIERIVVNGHPVGGNLPLVAPDLPLPAPLVIPPNPSDLRFELAGISFSAPDRVRFRFWLEGFEPGPGIPTEERSVTFRRLPPGDYTFHLSVATTTEDWSAASLAVPIRVLPAWHQTRLFRFGSVLGGLALFVGVLVARAANERRRRRRLEEEVAERTRELAAANQRIREQNRHLEELSRTDHLTGLANRRVLEEQLPLELAVLRRELDRPEVTLDQRYHGLAIVMIDIDHFKRVNDRFGHDAGDAVLRAVAGRLRESLREVDLLVRWGGEEFLLLARSIDRDGLEAMIRRLLSHVADEEIPLPGGAAPRITISAGFLQHPLGPAGLPSSAQWRQLVEIADKMLLLAKRKGRACAYGICRLDGGTTAPVSQLLDEIAAAPESPRDRIELVHWGREAGGR